MSSRDLILGRIREALPGAPLAAADSYAAVQRTYQQHGALSPEARLDLLLDRLRDYDADIVFAHSESEVPALVDEVLHQHGETAVLLSPLLATSLRPTQTRIVEDHHLQKLEIEGIPAVLTTCEVAIASSGTLILVHGGAQGRRVATLLPDHHLCVLREDQIVERLPEAMARLAPLQPTLLTMVSGPSATSDIEMTRIRGVHGPRKLTVILLRENARATGEACAAPAGC